MLALVTRPERRHTTQEETTRIRAALVKLVEKHGTQTKVAELTGIAQSWISAVIGGTRAGLGNAHKLARFLDIPLDTLLHGGPAGEDPRLNSLPGWTDAAAAVISEKPYLSGAIESIGRMRIPPPLPTHITKDIVTRFAMAWLDVMPSKFS
jgi:transcriptional regulator with XRE-family HTH domain